MALYEEQWWAHKFHNNFALTYQQTESKLLKTIPGVMVHRGVDAAIDYFERLGAGIASDTVTPFGQTVIQNISQSRRAALLQSSQAAILVSDEHELRSLANSQSGKTQVLAAMMSRRQDKHVIDAAIGSSLVASTNTTTAAITYASQAMLTAQIIGGATAMDLDRVVEAGVLLSKAGVPSEGRYMLYSPGQLEDIMAITQASSSDFTKNQIHDRGTINGLMWQGFTWIEIADVVDEATSSLQRMLPLASTTRSCIAYHGSGIGLAISKDPTSKVSPRPDLSDSLQVRVSMMMKAVRVFEGAVVQVDCLEN